MSAPTDWTLAEAGAALARRAISSVELTEACLVHARAWQGVTNAFIDLRAETALTMAAAADAAPRRSPLHGIPLAHKDMFYRDGQISTCGSTLRRDWRADRTASVLARLDAAGAVDLGTLNMAEWAGGATGHNLWFGDACNPWNPDYVTGGSSSGTGAAVASRAIFAGMGSDTGGSIRIPAAMCGLAGLKPTWGAVSRYGAMPRAWTLDVVGPLARTAEDCALLFAAIAGADAADPTTAQAADFALPERRQSLLGVVIGVARAQMDGADPAIEAALATLRGLGATLRDVEIPDLAEIFDLGGVISATEAASIHQTMMRDHPEGYAPDLFTRMQAGLAMPAMLYLRATRLRAEMLARVRKAIFAECAALFLPSLAVPTPTREASRTRTPEDVGRLHGPLVRNTRPFNYLGLPALTMPCGFDARGLPVGFQLAGAPFAEAVLLAIGMAYERECPWHRTAPALPAPG
jgi:aspartyl-tRNA(Asn)/glutamyl-tRNA(Gln) amidotransferase subunit A